MVALAPTSCSTTPIGTATSDTTTSTEWTAAGPLRLSTTSRADGQVLVTACGEIDICTGPTLLSWLERALAHPSCATLILDLRKVGFMSARGVGILTTVQADAVNYNVRFIVVADQIAVLRPLHLTAVDNYLTIFPTVAAAGHATAGKA